MPYRKRGETNKHYIIRLQEEITILNNQRQAQTIHLNELMQIQGCVPIGEYTRILNKYQELVDRLKGYNLWVG